MGGKTTRLQTTLGYSVFLCVGASTSAAALDTSTVQSVPASIWWVPIVSALIGAISALATPFIKDMLLQVWNEKRVKLASQDEIFRNYAAPLAASSERLIWRFKEIFVDSRHYFLKTSTLPLVYNEYKRKSTLYRIASLLGWMRAIHLELSALPRGASGFLTSISEAFKKVQVALADGPHVELHRLEQLCAVWRLEIGSVTEDQKKNLATRLEILLYELAGDKLRNDSNYIGNLNDEGKMHLCRSLANFLCDELRRARLDEGITKETMNQAVAAMSYREALIYRDWQDAIGDIMLERDPDSIRKFKIIGYERFEQILGGNSLWIKTFRESVDDIDFESLDPNDFRAKQLKDLSTATSEILISLSQTKEKDLVDPPALEVANRLLTLT